ncbi:MAG TPA: glycosyltransferase family A protein [Nitrososphaeraceae archaeon]|nr:glycosyltransferase family A protein [Nitrososphaeraceae archaeon]
MGSYNVIVTCRNSENSIKSALNSIIYQSIKPEYIIVVDDGSSDNTNNILKDIQSKNENFYIITNPDLGYNIGRVVNNWNKALELAKKLRLKPTDYHMIAPDDAEYEENYCQKIIKHMDSDQSIVIASGNYDINNYKMPRGAGRLIRNSFFFSIYSSYPERMGYETIIFYSALENNFKYKVIPEARFVHTRTLGSNHQFYEFGASMRTLGYHPIFVLGRFLKYFISGKPIGRLGSIHMIYYYLTYKPKENGYDSMFDANIRKNIRSMQTKRIMRYIGINKI